MCQDEIGLVRAIDRGVGEARVAFDGIEQDVSLLAFDGEAPLDEGDWVVTYQGYVLDVLDEATAMELVRERRDAGLTGVAAPDRSKETS